uniref:Uncharacterized protein n=1 Tax=Vespula pensylvanica TaxID=30213 RepID=A0A834PDM6_VESPE|nr:hypothetical protein H0235_003775 [Vespula pensylvanica]
MAADYDPHSPHGEFARRHRFDFQFNNASSPEQVVPLKGDFIDQPIRVTESQTHFEREVRYESYALPHSFRGNSLERSLYSAKAHENTRMLKKFFEHFVAERRTEHSKCLRCFQEKIFL